MGKDIRIKRERTQKAHEARVWAITQLRQMTKQDREKLPCCFEYRALHAPPPIEGMRPICPPPGVSERLDTLPDSEM